jgi:UDP-3-O-[3-hydroxymyristoyl] glucosamine N-acyltransferase
MFISLSQLARLVDGQLHGDGELLISGADILRDAQRGEISLADSAKLADAVAASQAAAVVTPLGFQPVGIPYIAVADVHAAFARIVALFRPPLVEQHMGVSATAVVSPTARLGRDVVVHAHAFIGDEATIGPRTVIHSGARILAGCRLGADVVVFPNAVLYERPSVGDRSVIHASAVIGACGFSEPTADEPAPLSPQLGHVEIGEDVEIGACTTIDRGGYGATVIGTGTKIDNQVTIARDCRVGRHNIFCSQVGIAGGVTTGDYVMMAGQVGVRQQVAIGERATLGAKAEVTQDVPPGETHVGIPATTLHQQKLIQAALLRLPDFKKQLRELQRTMTRLDQNSAAAAPEEPA